MTSPLDVAAAFFSAIEAGDIAAVEALYAPGAVIWHNTDDFAQSVPENLRVLRWMFRSTTSRHYRILQRHAVPNGFVQQHVLELFAGSASFAMPASIFALVRGGQIVRLDEYLDSTIVQKMRDVLAI